MKQIREIKNWIQNNKNWIIVNNKLSNKKYKLNNTFKN